MYAEGERKIVSFEIKVILIVIEQLLGISNEI